MLTELPVNDTFKMNFLGFPIFAVVLAASMAKHKIDLEIDTSGIQ